VDKSFTITGLAVPSFGISSTSETIMIGNPLVGYSITNNTGGAIARYSISPSAPAGLTFSTTTGLLTGVPTAPAVVRYYTITATNAAGSNITPVTFALTIIDRYAQVISWAPTTTIYLTQTPLTPSVAAIPVQVNSDNRTGVVKYSKLTSTSNCSVNANTGVLTYTSVGTCVVRATAAQTLRYNVGTITVTFNISKEPQTITFNSLSPMLVRDDDQALTAITTSPVTTSGLIVTLTSNTLTYCTIVAGKVHAVLPGECSITATQNGNSRYAAATPVTNKFQVSYSTDETLSDIAIDGATFDPVFSSTTLSYTVTVAPTVTSISVAPSLHQPYAAYEVRRATPATSIPNLSSPAPTSVTLEAGANKVEVVVSAQNPVTPKKTYTLSVLVEQEITFVQPSDLAVGAPNSLLDASATSSRFVTITSESPSICSVVDVYDPKDLAKDPIVYTLVDFKVHAIATGTCRLTASLAGNNHYAAAADVSQEFNITAEAANPAARGIQGPGGGT
ncbi:MAG: cadherin-like beta sandwich domain-containing protein, partial [Actinomycetes bacterium]